MADADKEPFQNVIDLNIGLSAARLHLGWVAKIATDLRNRLAGFGSTV
jgi:hypothetical protein